jgi:hypothetical protein
MHLGFLFCNKISTLKRINNIKHSSLFTQTQKKETKQIEEEGKFNTCIRQDGASIGFNSVDLLRMMMDSICWNFVEAYVVVFWQKLLHEFEFVFHGLRVFLVRYFWNL